MRPATVFGIFIKLVPSVRVTLVQRNGQRELWERDIQRELKQRRRRRLRKRHFKKVNSRCFKLYRAYSISFNSSNVVKFLWS